MRYDSLYFGVLQESSEQSELLGPHGIIQKPVAIRIADKMNKRLLTVHLLDPRGVFILHAVSDQVDRRQMGRFGVKTADV